MRGRVRVTLTNQRQVSPFQQSRWQWTRPGISRSSGSQGSVKEKFIYFLVEDKSKPQDQKTDFEDDVYLVEALNHLHHGLAVVGAELNNQSETDL